MPIPLLVETEDALDTWGVDVPDYAHTLAKAFWPGAVTLVVKASEKVPRDFRAPNGTIGIRSPKHEVVMELIQAAGGPIFATSANTHGNPAPGSFEEVEPRIISHADVALDGGETEHQQASTVVDCTGAEPVILREGAVSADEIMGVRAGARSARQLRAYAEQPRSRVEPVRLGRLAAFCSSGGSGVDQHVGSDARDAHAALDISARITVSPGAASSTSFR